MKLKKLLGAAFLTYALVPFANADSIIKIPLSETTIPDVQFVDGVLSTLNDGDASTPGDQNTRIGYVGFLDFIADLNLPLASFTLSDVTASGTPTTGAVIVQATTGGSFSLYDQFSSLLISGDLGEGTIVGGTTDTGSFFNTTIATYTGGSLLAYVAPSPAGISFALSGIFSNSNTIGLVVTNDLLNPFVADATGSLTGNQVPEPFSAALLLSGVIGALGLKKKITI